MFANWRAWLKRKYGDLAGLNRAWGTKLESFDAIRRFPSQPKVMTGGWDRAGVDFTRPGTRGMHYDWCAFNNQRISDYFRALSERIHSRAPRVATHVKIMLGNYFIGSTRESGQSMDLSYHTFGIDPEALAASCSLLGGDVELPDLSENEKPSRHYGCVPYVTGWLSAGLAADFLKSLAPEKPFYDSEFHAIRDNAATVNAAGMAEHIATALWLAHLHGMNGNLLWFWARGGDGAFMGGTREAAEWANNSLLQQPWALRAYAQESLTLRRFVRPVMAFARQPRPVRLLYSEASAIQDVKYLDALRDAYEALNFLGVSIGLVTERQLAAGGLPAETRILIVPNARYVQDQTVPALKAARGKGVMVVVIGAESLTATPTGGHRQGADVPGAERIGLGGPQAYGPRFEACIKAAGIQRELLALDAAGRPAWGIEVRTAHDGDRRLAYLVNLMRVPVKVTLHWRASDARLRNWRADTAVADEVTLSPRQVLFGGY
jgi:beta-galactosidase